MNRSHAHIARNRLVLLVLLFGTAATLLLCRAAFLQIVGDPKLEKLARSQFNGKIQVKPRRGLILDRNKEPLAINLETHSLAGSPKKIAKNRATKRLLSRALNLTEKEIQKKFNPKKNFAWIQRHLTDAQIHHYRKNGIIQSDDSLPDGLWLVKEMKRVYPHGELAAPLIGAINLDAEGIEGAELVFNKTLRGIETEMAATRDGLGRPALIESEKRREVRDGSDIFLSIDASLQFSVEQELKNTLERTRADKGLAAIMDAETGEILALAHAPTFNANLKNGNSEIKRLRAITDLYEPGSTLKPLLVLSALESGRKITDGVHGGYGKIVVGGKTITEAEAHEKFGWISFKRLIEVSSNCASARLALDLGSQKYLNTLREMGLGQKTNVGFPGEAAGRLLQGKKIKPLELATAGFGHGIMVTPIQMLSAYATLANSGIRNQPTLIANNKESTLAKQVVPPELAKQVANAMLAVTEGEDGTGKKARVPGFRIAGKTGTAQTVDPATKRYSRSRYITSFIGFPVGTKRKLVGIALVDHPRTSIYASETAAPLFGAIMNAALQRFSVPATEPVEAPKIEESVQFKLSAREPDSIPEPIEDPAVIPLQNGSSTGETESNSTTTVPSLLGLTASEAVVRAQSLTHKIKIRGFGIVKSQIPAAGSFLRPGSKLELILSNE